MTRKRYVKLLMSLKIGRNDASILVRTFRPEWPYAKRWWLIAWLHRSER